jgi:hypothetical protein
MSGCEKDGIGVLHSDPSHIPSDVDECETTVCPGENEQCENTEGAYRCVCAEGYKQVESICVKEQVPGEWGGQTRPFRQHQHSQPCPFPTATQLPSDCTETQTLWTLCLLSPGWLLAASPPRVKENQTWHQITLLL